jgi:hypothetical protein
MPHSRPRRWLRFSLGSLLVVMTVLCIALAVLFNRARRQERAVRAIEAAGGYVQFDYHERYGEDNPLLSDLSGAPIPGPVWLRRLVGDELFRTPKRVSFYAFAAPGVEDAVLKEHLTGVSTAELLDIHSDQVTDAALPYIGAMPRVNDLSLAAGQVTDEGLQHLTGLTQLNLLWLDCPQVTDDGVARLTELDELVDLTLQSPRLTPAGIRQLSGLRNLESFTSLRHDQSIDLLKTLDDGYSGEPLSPPLVAALETLSAETRLPIDTSNLIPDERFSLVKLTTARTVEGCLEQLLEPAGLGWYLEEGTVKIATREVARERRAGYYAARETFPNAELFVDW